MYKCAEKSSGRTFAAKFVKLKPSVRDETKQEVAVMNELHHPKLLQLWADQLLHHVQDRRFPGQVHESGVARHAFGAAHGDMGADQLLWTRAGICRDHCVDAGAETPGQRCGAHRVARRCVGYPPIGC